MAATGLSTSERLSDAEVHTPVPLLRPPSTSSPSMGVSRYRRRPAPDRSVRYCSPGPTAARRSPSSNCRERSHALPASMKATTLILREIARRSSELTSSMVKPPIGRPPLSGLTSRRPQPRRLVEPPGNSGARTYAAGVVDRQTWPMPSMLPVCKRLASTMRRPNEAQPQVERRQIEVIAAGEPAASLLQMQRSSTPWRGSRRLRVVLRVTSNSKPIRVPACFPSVGSRPSAMRSSRNSGLASASSVAVLVSHSRPRTSLTRCSAHGRRPVPQRHASADRVGRVEHLPRVPRLRKR